MSHKQLEIIPVSTLENADRRNEVGALLADAYYGSRPFDEAARQVDNYPSYAILEGGVLRAAAALSLENLSSGRVGLAGFAVSRACRNQGYGAAALGLIEGMLASPPYSLKVLSVHPVTEAIAGAEAAARVRNFYVKQGYSGLKADDRLYKPLLPALEKV